MRTVRMWSYLGVGVLVASSTACKHHWGCDECALPYVGPAYTVEHIDLTWQDAGHAGCNECLPAGAGHPPAGLPEQRPVELPAVSDLTPSEPVPLKEEVREADSDDPIYARADDHTWLVGRLNFIQDREEWELRYAEPGSGDPYGGRVVLRVEPQMAGRLGDGITVRVHGTPPAPDSGDLVPEYVATEIIPLY